MRNNNGVFYAFLRMRNIMLLEMSWRLVKRLRNTLMNINVTFCYHKSHQIKGKLRITQVIEII